MNRFERNAMLFSPVGVEKLKKKRVTVFGIGGVGGYVVEMLARSGIGTLTIIDHDIIDITNINRQIIALESTVGKDKVKVMAERIYEINRDCTVIPIKKFILPQNKGDFRFAGEDFVVDAIDTVSGKLAIIEECVAQNVPIISSMGTGNKLNPELLRITDISKTNYCPLARVMRKELKNRGITHLPVLYSEEQPTKPQFTHQEDGKARATPSSSPFVPSAAGIFIASYVVRELLKSE